MAAGTSFFLVTSVCGIPVHAGPFDPLLGSWAGGGTATFAGGEKERLRCTGYYSGDQATLNLAIRCASPSNKIEMRAKLEHQGKTLTGTWEERTYNASGSGTGTVTGDKLRLNITGGVTGHLAVSFGDASQIVSLSTEGSTLTGVNIKLSRQ